MTSPSPRRLPRAFAAATRIPRARPAHINRPGGARTVRDDGNANTAVVPPSSSDAIRTLTSDAYISSLTSPPARVRGKNVRDGFTDRKYIAGRRPRARTRCASERGAFASLRVYSNEATRVARFDHFPPEAAIYLTCHFRHFNFNIFIRKHFFTK